MTEENEKTGKRKRLTQSDFLVGLRDHQVVVTFMDGKAVGGELLDFDKWTLFIRQESGLEMCIFKHAVKYVCLAGA